MKISILLLLIAVPFVGQSRDLLFNRLEKLHKKDQKKCLEVVQRCIKQSPEKAAPYYFASIIYDAKSDKSRTTEGKYRNMKRAIGYALTFEEKANDELTEKVNWVEYREALTERTSRIVTKLEAEEKTKFADDLLAQYQKLDASTLVLTDETDFEDAELFEEEMTKEPEILILPTSDEIDESDKSNETMIVNGSSKIQFYGLPKGNEVVMSADVDEEQEVLVLINKERVRLGMTPLEWDENLANAARYHAYDLATQDYFDHQSYDRKSGNLVQVGGTFDRIKKFYSASFVNSENIAAGNQSAEGTYEQWFTSEGHYENMFNESSRKVGLGVFYDPNSTYGYYWVFCTAL